MDFLSLDVFNKQMYELPQGMAYTDFAWRL